MMSKETVTRHTIALRKCLWQRAETETGTHKKGYAESSYMYGRPVRATQSYRRMMHLRKKLLRERERERESRLIRFVESTVESSRRVEESSSHSQTCCDFPSNSIRPPIWRPGVDHYLAASSLPFETRRPLTPLIQKQRRH